MRLIPNPRKNPGPALGLAVVVLGALFIAAWMGAPGLGFLTANFPVLVAALFILLGAGLVAGRRKG